MSVLQPQSLGYDLKLSHMERAIPYFLSVTVTP
jgi:hypothetical protein